MIDLYENKISMIFIFRFRQKCREYLCGWHKSIVLSENMTTYVGNPTTYIPWIFLVRSLDSKSMKQVVKIVTGLIVFNKKVFGCGRESLFNVTIYL